MRHSSRGLSCAAHSESKPTCTSRNTQAHGTGLRFLDIHASSHKALAEDAASVVANRQRLGGLGPIPRAIAAGAMTMTGSTISTLVAL